MADRVRRVRGLYADCVSILIICWLRQLRDGLTIGNNGDVVVVDREALQCLSASIDEPKTMDLTTCEIERRNSGVRNAPDSSRRVCLKATVEIVFSVDQVVIWDWYSRWEIRVRSLLFCHDTFGGVVIPIGLREM